MISRRLLRIKVLQVLYADYHSSNSSIAQSEKELFFSIQKTYDLYHYLMLLLIELVNHNEERIQIGREKHRPTKEELNPSTRFVENKIITQLKKNIILVKYLQDNKISWNGQSDLIKTIFNQMKEKPYFIEYLASEPGNYQADKRVVEQILTEEIPGLEPLDQLLEEQSIFWNNDLEFVISMIIKTIKGFTENDSTAKSLMPLFKNDEDRDFSKILLRRVLLNHVEYNELIKQFAQNWEFERIAIMDIILMQMSIAEFIEIASVPTKVTLNEYIEIAKYYSTAGSSTFINGILDKIIAHLKKDDKIKKQGRGLIGEQ